MRNSQKSLYLNQADLLNAIYFEKDSLLCPSPEFHESIEFIFLLEGSIRAHVDNQECEINKGEIIFVDSFKRHYYEPKEKEISAFVLVLSQEYTKTFQSYYANLTIPTLLLDHGKNKELEAILDAWHQEKMRNHLMNEGYANLFLSKIALLYPLEKKEANQGHEVAMSLLAEINKSYLEDISLKEIAERLGYSEEYCSKKLKQLTGGGFRDYLNTLRLRKANELLADASNRFSKSEIIFSCGFSSPATFYRAQKRFIGKSASSKS